MVTLSTILHLLQACLSIFLPYSNCRVSRGRDSPSHLIGGGSWSIESLNEMKPGLGSRLGWSPNVNPNFESISSSTILHTHSHTFTLTHIHSHTHSPIYSHSPTHTHTHSLTHSLLMVRERYTHTLTHSLLKVRERYTHTHVLICLLKNVNKSRKRRYRYISTENTH